MIEKMLKVTLMSPISNADTMLESLFKINCFHPVVALNENLQEYETSRATLSENRKDYERYLALKTFFSEFSSQRKKSSKILDNPKQLLAKLEVDIQAWKLKNSELERRVLIYQKYQDILTNFLQIIPEVPFHSDLQVRGILLQTPKQQIEHILRKQLQKVTDGNFDLDLLRVSKELSIGSLVYLKHYDRNVSLILDEISISDLSLPQEIQGSSLRVMLVQLQNFLENIEHNRSEMKTELTKLYSNYISLEPYFSEVIEAFQLSYGKEFLKQTGHFVIIEGYIPKEREQEFDSFIKNKVGLQNSAIIYDRAEKNAPVKIKNSSSINHFQLFTGMLPPLAYGSIDPTMWIAIFFPLFFGFIVGDIAYGLVIVGVGRYLMIKSKEIKNNSMADIGFIYVLSGISTIFFGILYGEFLGNLGTHLGLRPIWMERSSDLMFLLVIAVLFGIVHVSFGLILGCINGYLLGDSHRLYENLGLIIIYASIFGYVLDFLYFQIQWLTYVVLIFGIFGTTLLIKGEGVISLLEIVSVFGNILSYARLMALGVASVILADLANELYTISGGGVQGILIALVLHLLNIAIAMFSPLLHSMRLHLVEFFSKFVAYGENSFTPYGASYIKKIGG